MNNNESMIEFLESQIANHQHKIDELKGHFDPETLTEKEKPAPMFGHALCLGDAKAHLTYSGDPVEIDHAQNILMLNQGGLFISYEAAELESEKRKLRQLARVRMAESWGDNGIRDYREGVKLFVGYASPQVTEEHSALTFKTIEHAKLFIKEVGQEGIKKILSL